MCKASKPYVNEFLKYLGVEAQVYANSKSKKGDNYVKKLDIVTSSCMKVGGHDVEQVYKVSEP